jgi:hypothetical protein
MKELKPVTATAAGRKPVRAQAAGQTPPASEATMQTDVQVRRSAGRLSREDQRRLGDILQRIYDEVVRQGVPDRFKLLLNEIDGAGQRAEAGSGPRGTEGASENGEVVGARALGDKRGSH